MQISFARALKHACAAIAVASGVVANGHAMTLEERRGLDLSSYTVVDSSAAYFDVEQRIQEVRRAEVALIANAAAGHPQEPIGIRRIVIH